MTELGNSISSKMSLNLRPESPRRLQLKRAFVMALGTLSLVVWFSFIALFEHYAATRPQHADRAAGRVYVLNNHGSYAYLTQSEQRRLWYLEFGAWPLFIAAVALGRVWNVATGIFPENIPKHVRDTLLKLPPQNYKKVRATYEVDKNDDANTPGDK